jgi:fructan beta-fructosidase
MAGEKSGRTDYQTQGIAFSVDKGRTWTKYSGNPVLPNQGIKDFRDPKVSQIKEADGSATWLMTLAAQDRIQFFSSKDLKKWELLSEFGQEVGAHGGVWECPDLLPFKTPSGQQKYVLLVSINPGGPQKGSATQYFIGDFKNGEFFPDRQGSLSKLDFLDCNMDYWEECEVIGNVYEKSELLEATNDSK